MIWPSTCLAYRRPNVVAPTLPGVSNVSCSCAPVRALSLCWVKTSSTAAWADDAPSARMVESSTSHRERRQPCEDEVEIAVRSIADKNMTSLLGLGLQALSPSYPA